MRHIFYRVGLVLIASFLPNLANARLDIQKDCLEAARIFSVLPTELTAFRSWCERFETQCYELEAASASACGGNGSQEASGRRRLAEVNASLGSNTSFQSGTSAGIQALEAVIITRKFQLQICTTNLDRCKSTSSTFQSQSGPKTLACSNFTPESEAWAAEAKAASNMCLATEMEIARVRGELAGAESQKNGMAAVSDATSGNDRPTSNQAIRLPVEDARACGMFGCEANADGTFSPRYAPNE